MDKTIGSNNWTPREFIEQAVEQIRDVVGTEQKVVCALSGGVDSSVVAFLLDRAVGERLISIFVDHGLLRKGEAEQVAGVFSSHLKGEFIQVDARELFLERLKVTDRAETADHRLHFIDVFKEKRFPWGMSPSWPRGPFTRM